MLTGYGSQRYLKKSFHDDREEALVDRSKYSTEDLDYWEVSQPDGGGRTDPETYELKQFPFPTETSIRRTQKINMKKVDPRLGEASD